MVSRALDDEVISARTRYLQRALPLIIDGRKTSRMPAVLKPVDELRHLLIGSIDRL
jgi:hypothetical protein